MQPIQVNLPGQKQDWKGWRVDLKGQSEEIQLRHLMRVLGINEEPTDKTDKHLE